MSGLIVVRWGHISFNIEEAGRQGRLSRNACWGCRTGLPGARVHTDKTELAGKREIDPSEWGDFQKESGEKRWIRRTR